MSDQKGYKMGHLFIDEYYEFNQEGACEAWDRAVRPLQVPMVIRPIEGQMPDPGPLLDWIDGNGPPPQVPMAIEGVSPLRPLLATQVKASAVWEPSPSSPYLDMLEAMKARPSEAIRNERFERLLDKLHALAFEKYGLPDGP